MKLHMQLKNLLKKNDITVAQLSRATSVSNKTIYGWLDGLPPRNIKALKKVADHLDVSLDFLLFDDYKHNKEINLDDLKETLSIGHFEVILRKAPEKGK